MNVHIPAQLQRAGASPGGRRAALVLAVALVASLLALLPNLGDARAATLPPLAWGNNDHAQLGFCNQPQPAGPEETEAKARDPRCLEPTFSANAVQVNGAEFGNSAVTQLSAGLGHSLARRADGSVWAWGRNIENELGDGQGVYYVRTQGNRTTDLNNCKDSLNCPRPNPDRPAPGPVFQYTEVPTANTKPPIHFGPEYQRTFAPLPG